MNRVNLLPLDRQAAHRHRRARKRWLTINSLYGVILALVGASYIASRPASPATLVGPAPDLAALNATLVSVRQQTMQLQTVAASNASAAERPDFSRLLAAIAGARGEAVTLESVDLIAAKEASPRTLVLIGVAQSHATVTQFAMRVEAMGVFTAVRIADVTARPVGTAEGVGFRLQCLMPVEGR